MSPWWLMLPILTALTGWLSIQLAVKLFLTYYLPRQRGEWTARLAHRVAAEWFSPALLEEKIAGPGSFEKIRPQVEVHIDDFLRQGLPKSFPIIGTLIGERTISQLKEIFMKELETIFPVVMKGYIHNLQAELNPEQMIREKMAAIPTATIQHTVYQSIGSGINQAAWLAAGMGLLVGLGQLFIVLFTTGVLGG